MRPRVGAIAGAACAFAVGPKYRLGFDDSTWFVPVVGVGPSQVGVAWNPANHSNPAIQDFVQSCLGFKQP